jgi:hypothetical protein
MAVFYFHILLCIAVTAMSWFMHVVHYPLTPFVNALRWNEYLDNRRRVTIMITYPLMAFEALTGFTLMLLATQSPSYPYLAVSLALLVALLIFTFTYLNPQLKKINGPEDADGLARFMKLHTVRVLGWSARLLLLILIILAAA